jgi:hypothetical protein
MTEDIELFLDIDNKDEIDAFIEKIKFNSPLGEVVMFTNANSWYIETLVLNLIHSYNKFNNIFSRKIGVFCSDEEGYNKSLKLGFSCCMIKCDKMRIKDNENNVTQDEYKRLSFTKTLIIGYLTTKNYVSLYIDPDMSFNYQKYPNLDFIEEILNRKHSINYNFENNILTKINNFDISVDSIFAGSIFLNSGDKNTSIYLNTNLMLILPTIFNKILFRISINCFEDICHKDHNFSSDETYICRFGLDSKRFSFWSEHYYPNGLNSEKYKNTAYLFHANCVSGLDNKINLLKKCGGWYLDFIPVIQSLEKWQQTVKDEKELIVQASEFDEIITFCSIGMSFEYLNIKNVHYLDRQIGKHENLVLCAINYFNDINRRRLETINRINILGTLSQNDIFNEKLTPDEYFRKLPSYKFIISPEGNGIDCHRHYEALLAGCIPIIEDSQVVRDKYGDCPILYTTDYSEITHEYLEKKYEEMKTKLYDFSRLYMSYFSKQEQHNIKRRGNYHCNRLVGRAWYT